MARSPSRIAPRDALIEPVPGTPGASGDFRAVFGKRSRSVSIQSSTTGKAQSRIPGQGRVLDAEAGEDTGGAGTPGRDAIEGGARNPEGARGLRSVEVGQHALPARLEFLGGGGDEGHAVRRARVGRGLGRQPGESAVDARRRSATS